MYAEAMADDGAPPAPGQPRVTLFRVNPHMERLEAAMHGGAPAELAARQV